MMLCGRKRLFSTKQMANKKEIYWRKIEIRESALTIAYLNHGWCGERQNVSGLGNC